MQRYIFLLSLFLSLNTYSQVVTYEDSLNANLVRKTSPTVISGYGEAKYQYYKEEKTATTNVTRAIIFLGHKFSDKIQFFSEWELENAKVANGGSGEFSLEQFLLKYNINKDWYLISGLFVPRIGIINENHLSTTFNGNDRPYLESTIIPATWREIGVGLYGNSARIQGLNYSVALVNGLDASKFKNGTGIRDGRAEGSYGSSRNIAVTAAILYYYNSFRIQVSTYYGGSSGLSNRLSDSLQIATGAFALPINVSEGNILYKKNGLCIKAMLAHTFINDADKINTVYANNTPRQMLGYYTELGYDFLNRKYHGEKSLTIFVRYENINMDYETATNGIENGPNTQKHVVAGIQFAPLRGVAIKLDYHHATTGNINPALVVNPFPQMPQYYTSRNFINLGFGYSF